MLALSAASAVCAAEDQAVANFQHVTAADAWFADEVWPKVAVLQCVKCHKVGGDAEETRLVLADLPLGEDAAQSEPMRRNRKAFLEVAQLKSEGRSLLLAKVVGELDHGGKDAVADLAELCAQFSECGGVIQRIVQHLQGLDAMQTGPAMRQCRG